MSVLPPTNGWSRRTFMSGCGEVSHAGQLLLTSSHMSGHSGLTSSWLRCSAVPVIMHHLQHEHDVLQLADMLLWSTDRRQRPARCRTRHWRRWRRASTAFRQRMLRQGARCSWSSRPRRWQTARRPAVLTWSSQVGVKMALQPSFNSIIRCAFLLLNRQARLRDHSFCNVTPQVSATMVPVK